MEFMCFQQCIDFLMSYAIKIIIPWTKMKSEFKNFKVWLPSLSIPKSNQGQKQLQSYQPNSARLASIQWKDTLNVKDCSKNKKNLIVTHISCIRTFSKRRCLHKWKISISFHYAKRPRNLKSFHQHKYARRMSPITSEALKELLRFQNTC